MEVNLSEKWRKNAELVKEIEDESGVNIKACYQCGKCSAGCPMAFVMDVSPNRVIRLLQLGMVDEVLESRTPWVCATCNTCYTRCPRDIDLPKLLDTFRIITHNKGLVNHVKPEVNMHNSFMQSLINNGRVHEVGLFLGLKLRNFPDKLFDDVFDLGLTMFFKGKAALLPHKNKRFSKVKEMAERAKRLEGGH